jgi:hypothetical protein
VNIEVLGEEDFAAILLQRRFVSLLGFTPAYDLAIDLLRDEHGIQIARTILREEYPDHDGAGHTPSHREDMWEDMLKLGIPRDELVATRMTPATLKAVTGTFELMTRAGRSSHADLLLLTILRFWGEVLVSVEYGELWKRMQRRLTTDGANCSRFYYPHHRHDAKRHQLGAASLLATTHADQLDIRLAALLDSAEAKACFMETEEEVFQLKIEFYDQFVHSPAASGTPLQSSGR